MKFKYVKIGLARFVDNDGNAQPIPGNWIYQVSTGEGEFRRVLGLVQENPSVPNQWRAVASRRENCTPPVNVNEGLWPMTPGRSGFGSKREAAVWLAGASDARQLWFTAGWQQEEGQS